MKKIKALTNIVVDIVICVLLLYIVGEVFFPTQTANIIGYRFYSILTESMNPVISPGSLVLSKNVDGDTSLAPGDIITFEADLLGERLTYTHYLKKIEKDETGRERYYTQGNTAQDYDQFTTYRKDIKGVYITHVPYAGRVMNFIKSPFGMIEGVIIVLLLINQHIMGAYFEAQERLILNVEHKKISLRKVKIKEKKGIFTITGFVFNFSKEEKLEPCHMRMELLDKEDAVVQVDTRELPEVDKRQRVSWEFTSEEAERIEDYKITLEPTSLS